jgi:hypothetical protein
MTVNIRQLPPEQILKELSRLFMQEAHDRQVYCVFAPYAHLRPFQKRLQEEVAKDSFNQLGRVEYLSLGRDIVAEMKTHSSYERATRLADQNRKEEFRTLLSQTFRNLITSRIESKGTIGLILADFELLYAYDLGENDVSLIRQVAINGKRVCLLVSGAMRDGRLWIFDEDQESRREFPPALIFKDSGWVFSLQP